MNILEIENTIKSLGLEKYLKEKEIKFLPEFLNNDDKILHVMYTTEMTEEGKDANFISYLTFITNNKIIMLKKPMIGVLSKIIQFDKISLCERKGNKIILNLSGLSLKLIIKNNLNRNIFAYSVNAFLNKQNIEEAIKNVKNNPELSKDISFIDELIKLICNNFKAILSVIVVLFFVKSCLFDEDNKKEIQPTKSIAKSGTIPSDNYNVACFTKENYDALYKATSIGDRQHFDNLILSRKCHLLKDFAGKEYFVIDPGIMTSKIRIYTSNNNSIELYVSTEKLPTK